MYIYIYTYIYIYIHINIHICVCVCVYICICIDMCMYVYVYIGLPRGYFDVDLGLTSHTSRVNLCARLIRGPRRNNLGVTRYIGVRVSP